MTRKQQNYIMNNRKVVIDMGRLRKHDMYVIRNDIEVDFTHQNKIAKRIGVNKCTLSRILSGKQSCSKPVAFYITWLNTGEENIEEFFDKVGE